MKRIRFTALALCILAMCAGPQMAQGQTRHRAGVNVERTSPDKKHGVDRGRRQAPRINNEIRYHRDAPVRPSVIRHEARHCRPLPPPPRRPVCRTIYRPVYRPVHVVCCPPPEIAIAHAVVGTALTAVAVSAAINESRNNTVVVTENVPATLYDKLPSGYEEVEIGGTTYYKVGDTLYKTTIYNGNPYFEVAAVL